MDRTLSFSQIRKYNIPRVTLIYPQIQSGKSFFSPKPVVEFLFYKHSISQFRGVFNVLKLWLSQPQSPLFLTPFETFETCAAMHTAQLFLPPFITGDGNASTYSSP